MLKRWIKSLALVTTVCVLFANCKKNTFSADEPLNDVYTPSVFISSNNKILYALDPSTGNYKWQLNIGNNMIATPVVAGDFLYLPTIDTLFKVNVKTGKIIKPLLLTNGDDITREFYSSPLTDGRTVWIATVTGKVFAIDVNTDAVRWKYNADDSVFSSLMMYNGNIIVANSKGSIRAVNMNSGVQLWRNDTSVLVPTGRLVSSPVGNGTNLYIGSTDGNISALNGTTGKGLWKYNIGSVIDGSPIVYGGNIIVGSADNFVYCIDSAAKIARWKFKTNDRVLSTAAAYGQVVYIGSYDSYLYAINILDGSIKWRFRTGGLIQSTVLAANGALYLGSFDKMIYKVDTSGTLKWKYNVSGVIETSPILYDMTKTYYPSITGLGQY